MEGRTEDISGFRAPVMGICRRTDRFNVVDAVVLGGVEPAIVFGDCVNAYSFGAGDHVGTDLEQWLPEATCERDGSIWWPMGVEDIVTRHPYMTRGRAMDSLRTLVEKGRIVTREADGRIWVAIAPRIVELYGESQAEGRE